jgi:hypothetical protein
LKLVGRECEFLSALLDPILSSVKNPSTSCERESIVALPERKTGSQESLAVRDESLAVEDESLVAKSGSRK